MEGPLPAARAPVHSLTTQASNSHVPWKGLCLQHVRQCIPSANGQTSKQQSCPLEGICLQYRSQ
eukprot:1156236-Pelagomonas_calceolata.AAC.1